MNDETTLFLPGHIPKVPYINVTRFSMPINYKHVIYTRVMALQEVFSLTNASRKKSRATELKIFHYTPFLELLISCSVISATYYVTSLWWSLNFLG